MRIRIDEARCEGHGRCYAVAPELFEPDEIGNGRVIGDGTVPPGLAGAARRAFDNCPEEAITLEEENQDG
jgi:ferredoxin